MGKPFSLALSDGIFALRRMLADYEHEARVLDPTDARAFSACLKELGVLARSAENEISRHRWNDEARREREQRESETQAVMTEIQRPGTNLRLFPVMPRPFGEPPMMGGAS